MTIGFHPGTTGQLCMMLAPRRHLPDCVSTARDIHGKIRKMLTIIFVNYRSSALLDRCLLSIEKYEADYRGYEIIVVDNNSSDPGLAEVLSRFPYIKLIQAPENGGFAYGNNIGIRTAKYNTILLLNPDTYLTDNAISKLYRRMNNIPETDIIGPKLLNPDGSNQSYFLPKTYLTLRRLFCERLFLHRLFRRSRFFNSYLRTYMDYDSESPVEQVSGAAFMFRRRVIREIGLFDERYFMYFEESDFCRKAARRGFRLLYYPGSSIVHDSGLGSEANWSRSCGWYISSFKQYFKNNFSCFSYALALIIYFTGALLRFAGSLVTGRKKCRYYFFEMRYIIGFGAGRN